MPWRPAARTGLSPTALVHSIGLGPGNAHVGVAVQESQDREGHPWPAVMEAEKSKVKGLHLGKTFVLVGTLCRVLR